MLWIMFSLLAPSTDIPYNGQQTQQVEKRYSEQCGLTTKSRELAKLIIEDPLQQRRQLKCHPLLAQAAADKAKIMAKRGKVNHFVGGLGANERLRDLGYNLPPFYSRVTGNNVEAVAGGQGSPEQAWIEFKNSVPHRAHLLGEIPFYAEQNHIGVGYYYEWHSPHVDYWVVYIAREARPDDPAVLCLEVDCVESN